MTIRNKLVEEFEKEIKELGKMELGSKDYQSTMNGVTELADRIIEIDKIEIDADLKEKELINNNVFKGEQLKDEKVDRYFKNGLTAVNIIGGLLFAGWVYVSSMKYEEKGIIPTTEGGRASLKHLIKFRF